MLDGEGHAELLGRVVGNLLSLEFLLRAYLYAHSSHPHVPLAPGKSLDSLQVGELVGENALTDSCSLGGLIDRYNALVQGVYSHLAVDRSVVVLRDALAHGRVSATGPSEALTLLKFEKPSGGSSRVAFCEKLTASWLKSQVQRIWGEIQKVAQAPGSPVVP